MFATQENFKSPFKKKYPHAMELQLRKYVKITISLLKAKKPHEILKFRTYDKIFYFHQFSRSSLMEGTLHTKFTVPEP